MLQVAVLAGGRCDSPDLSRVACAGDRLAGVGKGPLAAGRAAGRRMNDHPADKALFRDGREGQAQLEGSNGMMSRLFGCFVPPVNAAA